MSKAIIALTMCFIIIFSCSSCYKKAVEFKTSTDSTYEPSSASGDIYHASIDDLKKLDLVHYSKTFGTVENEKEAVTIATKVFDEIYHDCSKTEAPFIVHFNDIANAWIVHGTLPENMMGGVASIAISKDSGEILMLIHTK